MANLTTSGTTGYPGVLDTTTTLVDGAAGDQILARHPNGLGAAVIALETELGTDPAGSLVDVKTRLAVALNNDGTVKSTVVAAGAGAVISYSSGVFTVGWSPDGPGYAQNLGINVTANSPVANALRIRLTDRNGSTPTSTSPIRIAFPVATASASPSNGTYVVREATGDTQMQLSSGSTLGTIINEDCRIYVGALDNNGTVEAVAWNSKLTVPATTSATARVVQLYTPSEVATLSTTAEGGAGGADSAATLYSTSARSGVYIRRLGYIDIKVGGTLGNWNSNPTDIKLLGPGVPTTGDVIQAVSTSSFGITRSGTTTIPSDGTKPQRGEGNNFLWATITSTNIRNSIRVESVMSLGHSVNATGVTSALFRNSEDDAHLAIHDCTVSNNVVTPVPLNGWLATNTSAAAGFYLVGGSSVVGTTYMNSTGTGAQLFGDSANSYLTISEICT